ncbi:MAG: DUF475 domain-containing protein [Minisyncoccia bacterium]
MFVAPIAVSFFALGAMYWWGGPAAFALAAALAVLEVTLSFDNAVVNAKVLARMTPNWQQRFLTWGMLISVLGVRLILPILIVSATAIASPITITVLAFANPAAYAALVASAGPAIESFGGVFLLLVALTYFFDTRKSVHWLRHIERRLVIWGQVESIELALALAALFALALLSGRTLVVFEAGIIGVILFVLVRGLSDALGAETRFTRAGAALFAYVSVLDAALSLDGVAAAFAITVALPIIVVGLGIGAYFVRTLTLAMVRGRALERFVYIEHGAHWAIFALACCMLASLLTPVPQWLTAIIGLFFIVFASVSSRREEVRVAS